MREHRYFSIERDRDPQRFESAETGERIDVVFPKAARDVAVTPSEFRDLPLHLRPPWECADIEYSVPGSGYSITIRVDERDARHLIEGLVARFPELLRLPGERSR